MRALLLRLLRISPLTFAAVALLCSAPARALETYHCGDNAITGPIYWARVVSFTQGQTVAGVGWKFDGAGGGFTPIHSLEAEAPPFARPWQKIELTPVANGACEIQLSRDNTEPYPGPVGTGNFESTGNPALFQGYECGGIGGSLSQFLVNHYDALGDLFVQPNAQATVDYSGAGPIGLLPTPFAGNYPSYDGELRQIVNITHPNTRTLSTTTAATTQTQIFSAPSATQAFYVTGIHIGSNVAAASQLILSKGTGTNCTTVNAVMFQTFYPASPQPFSYAPGIEPMRFGANQNICITDAGAGTKAITLSGYVAP